MDWGKTTRTNGGEMGHRLPGWLSAVGICALMSFAVPERAASAAEAARYDVHGYAVEGGPLLKAEDFTRIISPYIGRQKRPDDIGRARQALQQAYLDLGHCNIEVTVPKAEPVDGVVVFKLVRHPQPLTRECLPTIALDEGQQAPRPLADAGGVAVAPYTDVSGKPPAGAEQLAARQATAAAEPARARAPQRQPRQLVDHPLKPGVVQPPAQEVSPGVTAKPATPEVTPREVASGDVTAKPYVEGAGQTTTALVTAPPAAVPERKAEPKPKAAPAAVAEIAAPAERAPTPPLTREEAPHVTGPAQPAPRPEPRETARRPEPAPEVAAKPVEVAPVTREPAAPAAPKAVPQAIARAEPSPAVKPVTETPKAVPPPPEKAVLRKAPETTPPPAAPMVPDAPSATRATEAPPAVKPVPEAVPPASPTPARPAREPERATAPSQVAQVSQPEAKPAPKPAVEAAAPSKPAPEPKPAVKPAPATAQPPAPAAPVQAAAPSAPKFEIMRYVVEGNTLLKPEAIARAVEPHTGRDKDFGDVQRALEALQAAYIELGYGSVQITLPEQELERGEVRFVAVEPRLGKVGVQGNKYFDEANIRASMPTVREGITPNALTIADNLRLVNEHPAKQATVVLRAGEKEGELDATIRVADDKPWRASLTFDNTGTTQTGRYRVGAAYQYSNLFNRDHMITMQYLTSPENPNKVTIVGVGYRIPYYAQGGALDLLVGDSDVDSGTVQDLFTVSGSGTVYGVRYSHLLPKLGDTYEHKLVFGFDWRTYRNKVFTLGPGAVSIVPDITLHPVSLTYNGVWRAPTSELSYFLSVAQNVFPHGNDAAQSDFDTSRLGANAAYRIYRYGVTYVKAFQNDVQMRIVFTGQKTRDSLVSGEQFGLGGADNVRGLFEREIANDRGHRGQLEVYTPDLAPSFRWMDTRFRLLAFYDFGSVTRNNVLFGESPGQSVASAGIGLRLNRGPNLILRLDVAQVLDGGGSKERGATRGHFSFAYLF